MGVSLFLPIADAAPCTRPSGFLRFRISCPVRGAAGRCVLRQMQAILRGLRGQTDTRIGAISRWVISSLFALPEVPISGQSGHSIKKKRKTRVLRVQRRSGKGAWLGGVEGGSRRIINMPGHLTGNFLHCKQVRCRITIAVLRIIS